jgi:hypothetical protein
MMLGHTSSFVFLVSRHRWDFTFVLFFRLAELKKESGNQLYKTKKYQQAVPFYTEAIGK